MEILQAIFYLSIGFWAFVIGGIIVCMLWGFITGE